MVEHGAAGDEESLLDGVLAAQDGVADHIGINHPDSTWSEFPAGFGTRFLELVVFLEPIVKAHHEAVVG